MIRMDQAAVSQTVSESMPGAIKKSRKAQIYKGVKCSVASQLIHAKQLRLGSEVCICMVI